MTSQVISATSAAASMATQPATTQSRTTCCGCVSKIINYITEKFITFFRWLGEIFGCRRSTQALTSQTAVTSQAVSSTPSSVSSTQAETSATSTETTQAPTFGLPRGVILHTVNSSPANYGRYTNFERFSHMIHNQVESLYNRLTGHHNLAVAVGVKPNRVPGRYATYTFEIVVTPAREEVRNALHESDIYCGRDAGSDSDCYRATPVWEERDGCYYSFIYFGNR